MLLNNSASSTFIFGNNMKVHFIAIGGSAMHNLALALHKKGYVVTGSDDEIVEPSKSRLEKAGILPKESGWFTEKIHNEINAVILGMHARLDNPELIKAQELNIPIYSYPGYIFSQSQKKNRVVIGGSHGKTSITAMILHVLQYWNRNSDYLVGAQLPGFDTMVKLTEEAEEIILEGDEYLASPIERIPKFHLYKPNVAVISGIAWDHINVFPTFDDYLAQFKTFVDLIEPYGKLIYFEEDEAIQSIIQQQRPDISYIPYHAHNHFIENGKTFLIDGKASFPLNIFGKHNLQNISAAKAVCKELKINSAQFYEAIQSFGGAARRLEKIFDNGSTLVFKDFAHSPSKLKATTASVKEQFIHKKLIACMELHTFSSLNASFLKEYQGCMQQADIAYVYFNPKTVAHKKLESITSEQVNKAFGGKVIVFENSDLLLNQLKQENYQESVLLVMTSGNFDGIDLNGLPNILGLKS